MPRSKRSKLVSLTKTEKKSTKEHKAKFMEDIQTNASKWKYVYVIHVGHMRNSALKAVREQWKNTGRLFYGRTRVMAHALGTSPDTECRAGISAVSKHLSGSVGLFFTDEPPASTVEWFDAFTKPDFARAGNKATKKIVLPVGPITQYYDSTYTFPSSMDPQLRKLGLTTVLKKGIPSLDTEHVVCKESETLSKEQAQLLKLVGIEMADFKVTLLGRWSEDEGWTDIHEKPEDDGASGEVNSEADEEGSAEDMEE